MIDVRIVPGPAEDAEATAEDPARVRVEAGRLARGFTEPRVRLARTDLSGDRLTAFVEGLVLGSYDYRRGAPKPATARVDLAGVADGAALAEGLRYAGAAVWARDLGNTPANIKNPAWLGAAAARELTPLGVRVQVRDEGWLRDNGFGGVLAVGAGSRSAPCLIEASWRPRAAAAGTHLVLVGKGITFDTGGINLKPGESMKSMHTDMTGGAATLGALRAIAQARVPVRVTVLVPCAENSFSGGAMRPGDVIRHYGGRTSEVTNTDAEGRLVLSDALAYAAARLKPTAMVDIATLTGGMKVALGTRTGGLFATDDALADGLLAAGEAAGEPLWRMPMPSDYESALASDIADANNSPGNPQAVTAALWLLPFAGTVPWAHLDIAGPARSAVADGVIPQGATGFGARLLARWVESVAG
jgi:leucyl aminopeptidase